MLESKMRMLKLTDLCIVYALSSILALDPWHMLTSFIPYMLLSPMYINVLNMCVCPSPNPSTVLTNPP